MAKIMKIVKWLRLDKINTYFHRPTRIPGNSVEFSESDTQADKEFYQHFQNGLQIYPETARYD